MCITLFFTSMGIQEKTRFFLQLTLSPLQHLQARRDVCLHGSSPRPDLSCSFHITCLVWHEASLPALTSAPPSETTSAASPAQPISSAK
jgi:hypothetical protein